MVTPAMRRCWGFFSLILAAGGVTAAPPDFVDDVRVRFAGENVTLDEAIRRAAADPKVVAYRSLREEYGGTPAGQLELARWCRKEGLEEEERLHWRILRTIDLEQPEAIKALGLQKFQGEWLAKEQIAQLKQERKLAKAAERKWKPKLKRIKQAIEHGDEAERKSALDELQAIDDPHTMPIVAEVFSTGDTKLGLLVVEILAGISAQQATDTLARLAVHAPDADVRRKAASELHYRPRESYVPGLIAGLAAPIEMSAHVDTESGGPIYESYRGYGYTGRIVPSFYGVHRLRSEYTRDDVLIWGLETKPFSGMRLSGYVPDRTEYAYTLTQESPDPDAPYEFTGTLEALSGRGTKERELESMRGAIARLEKQVEEANAATAKMNERIHAALIEAVGADAAPGKLGKTAAVRDVHPRVWWEWWRKELKLNNYFAAGIEVWTQTGLLSIEKVLVGDRVLTRDSKTGDLAFNVVIGIDTQAQAVMREIELDSRTIVATPEQPFFLADELWQAASKLKPGTELHGLAGPVRVDKVGPATAGTTYSLLIDKAPNYFVDRQGILVHDATRH